MREDARRLHRETIDLYDRLARRPVGAACAQLSLYRTTIEFRLRENGIPCIPFLVRLASLSTRSEHVLAFLPSRPPVMSFSNSSRHHVLRIIDVCAANRRAIDFRVVS